MYKLDAGHLSLGTNAYITIFSSSELKDNSSFGNLSSPEGIKYVLIDGKIRIKDGEIVDTF